jgi:hypothetical protein
VPGVRVRVGWGTACALLLRGFLPSVLGLLMMTNDAAGPGAENAVMPSIMPGDTADGGTLEATSRLNWRRCPAGSR